MRGYSRSSTRTPSASANRRAVLGLAMRRSSSKSEMESADTPHLADAVYHVSTERGLRSVADYYLEKRPAECKRWEQYAEARREAEANPIDRALFGASPVRPMRPAELGGVGAGAA